MQFHIYELRALASLACWAFFLASQQNTYKYCLQILTGIAWLNFKTQKLMHANQKNYKYPSANIIHECLTLILIFFYLLHSAPLPNTKRTEPGSLDNFYFVAIVAKMKQANVFTICSNPPPLPQNEPVKLSVRYFAKNQLSIMATDAIYSAKFAKIARF